MITHGNLGKNQRLAIRDINHSRYISGSLIPKPELAEDSIPPSEKPSIAGEAGGVIVAHGNLGKNQRLAIMALNHCSSMSVSLIPKPELAVTSIPPSE